MCKKNTEITPETRLLMAIFGEKAVLAEEGDEWFIHENEAIKAEIPKVLATLPEEESQLIQYEYGFIDGTAHTLQESAERYALSENEIRQIEAHALRTLRHPSRSARLKNLR